LGTIATQAASAVAITGGTISGLSSLSVSGTATATTFSGSGTSLTGVCLTASNLSDLGSAATSRTNLGLGTAAVLNIGTSTGNIPVLGAGGLLPNAVLPPLAITDTYVVGSQAAMLALSSASVGDVAVRSDTSKSYILTADPY